MHFPILIHHATLGKLRARKQQDYREITLEKGLRCVENKQPSLLMLGFSALSIVVSLISNLKRT